MREPSRPGAGRFECLVDCDAPAHPPRVLLPTVQLDTPILGRLPACLPPAAPAPSLCGLRRPVFTEALTEPSFK